MAKKAKRKANFLNDIFITGTLRFPKLNEPDTFQEDKPCYRTGVVCEPAELARVKKLLSDFAKKCWPDAEKVWLPIKRDKKNNEIIFIDLKSRRTDKESGELIRPRVVDAKLKSIPVSINIGGGTIAKCKATAVDFEATKLTDDLPGVTLMLETVQVKKLEQGRDSLAGFEAEDGFSLDGEQDIESGSEDTDTEAQGGDAYDL